MTSDWDAITKIVGHVSSMITMLGMGWLAYKQAALRANVRTVRAQTQTILDHTEVQTDKIGKIEAAVAANVDALRAAQARALSEVWLSGATETKPDIPE